MAPTPFDFLPKEEGAESSITIEVQPSVYSMETILRTAHRFSGCCDVNIVDLKTDLVQVRLKPKAANALNTLEDDFLRELLDGRLREMVAMESRLERDLILAHALSRHPVLHTGYSSAEAFSDPLGLLAPDDK